MVLANLVVFVLEIDLAWCLTNSVSWEDKIDFVFDNGNDLFEPYISNDTL